MLTKQTYSVIKLKRMKFRNEAYKVSTFLNPSTFESRLHGNWLTGISVAATHDQVCSGSQFSG